MNALQTKDLSDVLVCRHIHAYATKTREIHDKWQKSGQSFFDYFSAQGEEHPFPYETLATETGCSEKVAFRAMERVHNKGLAESGVSLRTGWLTDKGVALLNASTPPSEGSELP